MTVIERKAQAWDKLYSELVMGEDIARLANASTEIRHFRRRRTEMEEIYLETEV